MRLIDEKALKEYQMQIPPEWIKYHLDIVKGMVEIFTRAIDNQPTIDAEPVVHGHWEETGRFEKDGVNYICYRCSICGGLHRERRKQTGNPNSIGCPHCRAKMDEEPGCET